MAIQNALAALWDLDVAGWKIGAASEAAMEMLGADKHRFQAGCSRRICWRARQTSLPSALHKCAVECEFAFRLGRAIWARAMATTPWMTFATPLRSAYPAIELINDYWVNGLELGIAHIIADNGSNGALVLGRARLADWRDRDLAAQTAVTLSDKRRGGRERAPAPNILGHPLNTLVWLANDLTGRGITMRRGRRSSRPAQ